MVGMNGWEANLARPGDGAKVLLIRKKGECQVAVMVYLDGIIFGCIFAE
jgi:hypothetical protein